MRGGSYLGGQGGKDEGPVQEHPDGGDHDGDARPQQCGRDERGDADDEQLDREVGDEFERPCVPCEPAGERHDQDREGRDEDRNSKKGTRADGSRYPVGRGGSISRSGVILERAPVGIGDGADTGVRESCPRRSA